MDDVVQACADLVGRAGAAEFELAWDCPHVPDEEDGHTCPATTWSATARYQGMRIIAERHRSPSAAALDLSEQLLTGAMCRCRQPVSLSDDKAGCRWRLVGREWQPGCDAPSLTVQGDRGDLAAMRRAMDGGNREQRRAAARKRGRRG